ncbi:hypothetical protein ERX46_07890 [Brumimicrobium glaciale]|uniref:DUF3575 domain-containing protein n=1 Tax=Brumimicrobium glaciale TaxID=200475 RepID=A0A4Q4KKV7_9FLAO|nr:hypothetical protein [Brumimicrobium glaciale]RYM33875.1 hypothetical protein ERX46_07890 [Brumimicrobium glaciale]
MKQLLCISLLFGFSISSFAQSQTKMIIEINKSISKEIFTDDSDQLYRSFNLAVGPQFEKQWGSIEIKASYIMSTADWPNNFIQFQSHFLGGAIKYVIMNKDKRFRPFIEINLFTEIATNYKDGYLRLYQLTPTDKAYDNNYNNYNGGYSSNFYDSTPFLGKYLVGMDVRLSRNLNLGVAVGFTKRKMLYRTKSWNSNNADKVFDDLNNYPTIESRPNMLELQLGLKYSFGFKGSK